MAGGVSSFALIGHLRRDKEFLEQKFTAYIEDRRREPRSDVLTGLANAKFPDGSTPEVIDVVRIAEFDHRQRLGAGVNLEDGQIGTLVLEQDAGLELAFVGKDDLDACGPPDHVIVGNDQPVRADDDAGPE